MRGFSVLTHVMQPRHIIILEDWLDFIDLRPEALIVVVAADPAIRDGLTRLCDARGMELKIAERADPATLKESEPDYLQAQFGLCPSDLAILVKLDTLPFREGHRDWMEQALDVMEDQSALYVTGSTRVYRGDADFGVPGMMRTRMVSNNFLMIAPALWLSLIGAGSGQAAGRYETEAAIERHCRETGHVGIRLLNRRDWRVFHTQIWDGRMDGLREGFRRGTAIRPHLRGFEDDLRHPWEMYYLSPPPSLSQRMRIALGEMRRSPIGGTRRVMRRLVAQL